MGEAMSKSYEELSRSQKNAEQAFAFMQRHGLEPNPVAYTLAYEYEKGEDTSLVNEVNRMIVQGSLDDTVTVDIFHTYIENRHNGKALNIIVDRIHPNLERTASILKEQGQNLNKVHRNIEAYPDISKKEALTAISQNESLVSINSELNAEIEKLKSELENAKEMARRDSLTGAKNRLAFNERLNELRKQNNRINTEFSIIILDIDDFKKINDNHGHNTGDQALIRVKEVIEHDVPQSSIYRYGGEEFALLLEGVPESQAVQVAEKAKNALKRTNVRAPNGIVLTITASFGVAQYRGESNILEFISNADSALYFSKTEGGKNTITTASSIGLYEHDEFFMSQDDFTDEALNPN